MLKGLSFLGELSLSERQPKAGFLKRQLPPKISIHPLLHVFILMLFHEIFGLKFFKYGFVFLGEPFF